MRRGSASASSATDRVAERHARLERVRHAGAVGLHEQVVDQVDARCRRPGAGRARRRPRSRRSGRGRRRAGRASPRRPSSSAARASGEKISFQRVMALERRQVRRAREALRLVVEAHLAPRSSAAARPAAAARCATRPTRGRERVRDVGVVAAEQLVAALAGQRHLHVLGGELRRPGRSAAPTSPRTARRTPRRASAAARRRPGARSARDGRCRTARATSRACSSSLNERSSKPIENVLTALAALARGERRERRRVDPAREQHADRHVGDEVRAHRVAQALAQLVRQLAPRLARARAPAAPGRGRA